MKKHIIFGALIAISSLCNETMLAQSEQHITVLEYNGKEVKTPLSQVGITVLNAGSTLSDEKGEAVLKFRTMHAGDRVSVRRIEKAGYEIFNSQAIDQWSVSPQRAFQIVLCRSDKFKSLRDQYSRVASDSYAKQYKAEQARLAAERKKNKMLEETYQQMMLDLENQYQQQLEDLENYVDQFARIDLSELNEQQQELINLVRDGKIDEAIQKYESADYQEQYKKQCEEISKIDKAQAQLAVVEAKKRSERENVFQAIHRQIATYRLAGGRENFQKITDLLKSVADADTTNLEAVWHYARHSFYQNLFSECEHYFSMYIRACQDNPSLQANAYGFLGQGYMFKNEFEKAENAYLLALNIWQTLADKEAGHFDNQLISIKCTLTNYYLWTNRLEDAEKLGQRTLLDCENRYKEEPEEYIEDLSDLYSLNSLILFYYGKAEEAIILGQKSVELARVNFKHDMLTADPLIRAISSFGQVCYLSQNWIIFKELQDEYVSIVEELYKKNPDGYLLPIKSAYNNLAEAQFMLNETQNAEESFIKADKYLDLMKQKDPTIYHYEEFTLYELGARIYQQSGNSEKMRFYLNAALKAYDNLTSEMKEQFVNEYEGLKNMQ